MKNFILFSRIFVGLVFIFSSFVKGVDPLGTAYQIDDYFIAFNINWASSFSLFLSIALSTFEFLIGICLLVKLEFKKTSWALFGMMNFFLILTFYNALTNTVTDCACFGDAIKLSNWATFYKNLVLLVFVFIVFFYRSSVNTKLSTKYQRIVIIAVIIGFAGFSYYQYKHLPLMDFRQWKIGADITPSKVGTDSYYLTYKNINTGETKEYLSPNYPWQDTAWVANWEFQSQRIDEWKRDKSFELVIEKFNGKDMTKALLSKGGNQFIIVARDLATLDIEIGKKLVKVVNYYRSKGYSYIGLTNSSIADYAKFRTKSKFRYQFYQADEVILKGMIRANPGIIIIKDRKIINKLNLNDHPDIPEKRIEKTLMP